MTMDKFKTGQSTKVDFVITPEMSTNRTGKPGADVLSTPSLLGLMEGACIKLTEPFLPENYSTVGYAVDGLRHLAPTQVGETVTITIEVTEVDSKKMRLGFKIEATENGKTIVAALRAAQYTNRVSFTEGLRPDPRIKSIYLPLCCPCFL